MVCGELCVCVCVLSRGRTSWHSEVTAHSKSEVAMSHQNPANMGPAAWKGMEKMNSELFTLTYGALVAQLLRDHEDVEAVNVQLDKMGYVRCSNCVGETQDCWSVSELTPECRVVTERCFLCFPNRHNIGVRLIDEFLAKSQTERCANFESTANLVAKVGLKMFLGINATVEKWNSDKTACSIKLSDNPFQVRLRF